MGKCQRNECQNDFLRIEINLHLLILCLLHIENACVLSITTTKSQKPKPPKYYMKVFDMCITFLKVILSL